MPTSALPPPQQLDESVLSTGQERSLRQLALMLSDNAGFKLALATFSGLKQRTLLINRLSLLLEKHGVAFTHIVFTAGDPNASLLRSVREHVNKLQLPPGSRHALSVVGLENLIALRDVTGNRRTEGVSILEEANLHRDTFAKACPLPLLIWLTTADTTAFAKAATDLWHWRSATFDFTDASTDGASTIGESIEFQNSTITTYSPEKLRERQALLEKQLAELKVGSNADTPRAVSQRVNLLMELANVFCDLNDYDKARQCFEECLTLAEQAEDKGEVAIALNNLAKLLFTIGQFAEAEPLMRRALEIDEKNLGPEHPNAAIRLNNLARLLHDTHRLEEAELLFRRALAIDEKSYGTEDPTVAIRLNNLAQLLQDTNRLAEAEPLMRRSLAIIEKNLGQKHPNVASGLSNMARLLHATHRLSEAEPLVRRALAIDEKNFGQEHPNVAVDLNNLARLLQDTSRLAEAEPVSRRAAKIFVRSLGLEHPNTKNALQSYKSILFAMNLSKPEIQAKLQDVTGQ